MSLLSVAKDLYKKNFPQDKPWHERPGIRKLVPGTSAIKSLKLGKYGSAAKHMASDMAYWSTVALPDRGFVSGPAVSYLTHNLLFPHGTDTESGKRLKKIKEAVYEYRYNKKI